MFVLGGRMPQCHEMVMQVPHAVQHDAHNDNVNLLGVIGGQGQGSVKPAANKFVPRHLASFSEFSQYRKPQTTARMQTCEKLRCITQKQ